MSFTQKEAKSEPIFPASKLASFTLNPKIKEKLKKPFDHFNKHNAEFKDPGHTVTLFKKKPKGKEDSERDKNIWFNVINPKSQIVAGKSAPLADFILLSGETGRFMIGPDMPKYRFCEIKGETKVFSKEIKRSKDKDFFDFLDTNNIVKGPIKPEHVPQLVMRGAFLRLVLEDNDYHFNNAKINYRGALIVFDWDRSCYSLSSSLRIIPFFNKAIQYPSSNSDYEFEYDKEAKKYFVKDKQGRSLPCKFMGTQREKDFPILPKVHHFMPNNWQFNQEDCALYSAYIQKHIPSLNEKHFSLMSLMTMIHFYLAMQEVFIADENHLDKIQQQFRELIRGFKFEIGFWKDCRPHNKEFDAFRDYLKNNFYNSMLVVFYEMHNGFKENKHYQLERPDEDLAQWQLLCEHALRNLVDLLETAKIPVSKKEIDELRVASMLIRNEDVPTLEKVSAFYQQQEMTLYADRLQQKLDLLKKPSVTTALTP